MNRSASQAAGMADRRRQPRPGDSWIPEFCRAPVLLWSAMLAQVILLFLLLAPLGRWPPNFSQLGLGTVYVQWLCVVNLAALCLLRPWLARMLTVLASALILSCVTGLTLVAAAVAAWLNTLLGLHAMPPGASAAAFATSSAAMALLVAAAALRYAYVAAQWRQGVAASARAQFDALQARIRPHFLFNSMNTIAALIRTRPRDAESAVEDLSDLFRSALRDEQRPTTLAEEIDLARRYLAIEKLRLGDRLRLSIDADDPPDLAVPALLLQPLVENAVVHGVEPLPEGGEITFRTHAEAGTVQIDIRNPTPRTRRPSRGSGTALDNVRRRLAFHFDGRAHMEVDEGADYYAVRLRLPMP
ncbi:MAG: histidine kinase [Xanthomonadaceae bacterium]|nr:histidine kinase [Xanthomonadaceae bacterium]